MTQTVVTMKPADDKRDDLIPADPSATSSRVSVLVPCCGQLEYTRLCVPSLLRYSTPPYELIFIDIGSLDGTAEYLAGVAAAAPVRVEVVRTVNDLGIPAACREALARARGEFLVLLNNDTVVTNDWLDQLVALARLAPDIGMVGPMSNYARPPQLVDAVPYRIGPKQAGHLTPPEAGGETPLDLRVVDQFARQFREQHRGRWKSVDRLAGFCLLLKRHIMTTVLPLLPRAGLGVFDTDELCAVVRQAGYTLACCQDLFIHHFGSRTFVHGGPHAEPESEVPDSVS